MDDASAFCIVHLLLKVLTSTVPVSGGGGGGFHFAELWNAQVIKTRCFSYNGCSLKCSYFTWYKLMFTRISTIDLILVYKDLNVLSSVYKDLCRLSNLFARIYNDYIISIYKDSCWSSHSSLKGHILTSFLLTRIWIDDLIFVYKDIYWRSHICSQRYIPYWWSHLCLRRCILIITFLFTRIDIMLISFIFTRIYTDLIYVCKNIYVYW